MIKVCIIQPVMKAYRVPFFIGLSNRLAQSGITLQVVYGTPWVAEAKRGDHAELPSHLGKKVKSYMLFGKLFVQPVVRSWITADLVVVEHANKHLLNYFLTCLWRIGIKRIAYWGHGRNRQGITNSLVEKLKRRTLHWADWWFAYTSDAAKYVAQQGFDHRAITVVENAVDTRQLRADLDSLCQSDRETALTGLGWTGHARIAVFCGSIYKNKRLDILFSAAELVHASNPDFRLLIIGGGPLATWVSNMADIHSWIRYVGPKFGHDKSVMLSLAEMFLNPGLVGLGILDAFCAGLPLLTSVSPSHGPEIEYLVDGQNGLMLAPTPESFANGILSLLNDENLLDRLRKGAYRSSQNYSIEAMIENFAAGVERCLAQS